MPLSAYKNVVIEVVACGGLNHPFLAAITAIPLWPRLTQKLKPTQESKEANETKQTSYLLRQEIKGALQAIKITQPEPLEFSSLLPVSLLLESWGWGKSDLFLRSWG